MDREVEEILAHTANLQKNNKIPTFEGVEELIKLSCI